MTTFPRRVRWLDGRRANVDGIPFELPVRTRTSPALFAGFSVDADAAAELLPGQELHPCRVWDRGVLVLAVVDYRDTTIGRYVEFCIGVLATRGRRPAARLVPLLAPWRYGTGVYIHDLPVSTEISVKGGLGIWGMPKRQANLDFVVGDEVVSSQYDLEGQLVARIDVGRPARPWLPVRAAGTGYGAFRGLLTKSVVHLSARVGPSLSDHRARLLLGDHPRAERLKQLDVTPEPLFTGFAPVIDGVLDDHVETWFLTADTPPRPSPAGMADVIDLGLSQKWLAPPDRERTDRLLQELSPRQWVGAAPRPPLAGPDLDLTGPAGAAHGAAGDVGARR